MGARVRFDPAWRDHLAEGKDQLLDELTEVILSDMQRGCPVDTGALLESLDREVVDGSGGKVGRVGSRDQEHSTYVELGTGPHVIRSHGPYPLRNAETGQVFGPVVHHPGTPPQPYMRPALYRQRG